MTYDLFDLTYRVAHELGETREGLATGGSTTTLVDTARLQDNYNDDHFNLGTVWILRDSAGAGAAPEGEFGRISDFVSSTGTVTVETMTGIASGDRYAIADGAYPLDELIGFVNKVLDEIMVRTEDTTTIDTAAEQTEYSLPATLLDERIEVWLQSVTDDANDNRWIRWHDWYISEQGTGAQKLLVMKTQPPYAYDVKIIYWAPHPSLWDNDDKLRESVDLNRVVLDAAYRALNWKITQSGDTDEDLKRRVADLLPRVERAKWRSPVKKAGPKLATLGTIDSGFVTEES